MRFIAFLTLALCLNASVYSADPTAFKVGSLNFTRPGDWKWVEVTSMMRKAQLEIPGAGGKAEVIFFEFPPGQGGDAQANINRWFTQFQEPKEKIGAKTEKKTVGTREVTYVQAEGTYLSGMPGTTRTPMPNYALQGAIIEGKDGNIFIRLTGPAALVKSSQAPFKKMIEDALR